jgi:hypothetical protein
VLIRGQNYFAPCIDGIDFSRKGAEPRRGLHSTGRRNVSHRYPPLAGRAPTRKVFSRAQSVAYLARAESEFTGQIAARDFIREAITFSQRAIPEPLALSNARERKLDGYENLIAQRLLRVPVAASKNKSQPRKGTKRIEQ